MAADLRSITFFSRNSLVLMDDYLVKLEHEFTQDRIRRYRYDTIQGLLIWSRPSWARIAIFTIILLIPGVLMALLSDQFAALGWVLTVAGAVAVAWYFFVRAATIRIIRFGTNYDIKCLVRPGKLRRFRDKFVARIQAAQIAGNVEAALPPPEQVGDIPATAPDVPPPLPGDLTAMPTT